MKVLMIGGSGLVGSLVLPYIKQQHTVRVFDLRPPANAAIDYVQARMLDSDAVQRAAEGMDALLYMVMNIFNGTELAIAESCFDYFFDEDMPPDARGIYGLTKHMGEEVCRNAWVLYGISVNALRLCLPMSREKWLEQARAGKPDIPTEAEDVASAMLAALEYRNGFRPS